jgi:hypothetical protein
LNDDDSSHNTSEHLWCGANLISSETPTRSTANRFNLVAELFDKVSVLKLDLQMDLIRVLIDK